MKHKVLVIEDDVDDMRVLRRVIGKANLEAVTADTLTRARHLFSASEPESFLCAIIDYSLPDARNGEGIDFAIEAFLPVIAITTEFDLEVRNAILAKNVVDYVPKENAQIFEYISRLLYRLEKNKEVGVLIAHPKRSSRAKMTSLLLRHNFKIFEAADIVAAETLIRQHASIKLVMCFEKLLDGNGINLIASLRKYFGKDDLSIIAMTEQKFQSSAARFIKSGANDYIYLPFSQEAFLCRVMQNVEHIEHIDTIKHAANKDYLTGLPNRRYFFELVQRELGRKPSSMALALIDLDHFKSINDTMGHDAGDEVLKRVSSLISEYFKVYVYARFGGEEFCVFMQNTSLDEAIEKMEAFRLAVNEATIEHGKHKFTCKLSIGVTARFDGSIESMLKQADLHLYHAKESGRNRVISDQSNPS